MGSGSNEVLGEPDPLKRLGRRGYKGKICEKRKPRSGKKKMESVSSEGSYGARYLSIKMREEEEKPKFATGFLYDNSNKEAPLTFSHEDFNTLKERVMKFGLVSKTAKPIEETPELEALRAFFRSTRPNEPFPFPRTPSSE